jgi:hypothetical protein
MNMNNKMKIGHEDLTELCSQTVHTDIEVTANRPDVIITSKQYETCTH